MFIDARQLPNGSIIEGDICIIGAGAAGISMALDWKDLKQKVILLEGGGFAYENQIQDLNKTESPWSIVFWFTALTTPLMLIAMPFVYQPHDGTTWAIIIAMALCGALAQMLLTTSLRFGSAGVILLMDYTSLLWATWYGYTVFDRSPPTSLWLGAPLIIAAGLLIAWRERKLAIASEKAQITPE